MSFSGSFLFIPLYEYITVSYSCADGPLDYVHLGGYEYSCYSHSHTVFDVYIRFQFSYVNTKRQAWWTMKKVSYLTS